MSTKLAGYDETVVCPYNKSHVIMRERFQFHLVRCARSYPNIKLEVCPFDSTHHIPKDDLKAHTEECPSRANFDRFVYSIDTKGTSSSREPPKPQPVPVQADDEEENWDHYETPTYDPRRYAKNAYVLRAPTLLTPAERRKFADDERKRLSELQRQGQGQQ